MLRDIEACTANVDPTLGTTAPGFTELRSAAPMPGTLDSLPSGSVSNPLIGAESPALASSNDAPLHEGGTNKGRSAQPAPNPRPRRSRALLVTVLVLGALLVGLSAVGTWMISSWMSERETATNERVVLAVPGPSPSTPPVSAPAPVTSTPVPIPMPMPIPVPVPREDAPSPPQVQDPPLDPATIRQRIIQAGWTVSDTAGDDSHPDFDWHRHLAQQGSERATVNVYVYRDADKAAAGEAMLRRQNRAVARRGLVVVYVYRETTDQTAWQLLQLLIT